MDRNEDPSINDINEILEGEISFDLKSIENSPDCTKIIDHKGEIKYINQAGLTALGLAGVELGSRLWLDLLPPDVREPGEQALSEARSGQSSHFAGKSIDKDGAVRHWDNHLIPLTGVSRGKWILCISRDVTDSLRMEGILTGIIKQLREVSSLGLSTDVKASEEVDPDTKFDVNSAGALSSMALHASDAELSAALAHRFRKQPASSSQAGKAAADVALTSKERECLFWVGMGKTSFETGVIIGRSARTIEFHLANAVKKLGASNKVHAAMIAFTQDYL